MRRVSSMICVAIGSALLLSACGQQAAESSPAVHSKSPAATLAAGEIVPWADIPAPLETRTQPDIPPLESTLFAPSTVRVGETLRYQLTVRNSAATTYRWPSGCPVFLAILQTAPPEPRNVAGNHQQLNCRLARDLSPGDEARFELLLLLPPEVPAGQWILALSFTQPGHSASPPATASLTVEP
ncbi:MAG: hypothetical protein ABI782_10190 [Anaerolineaceae bacterium]